MNTASTPSRARLSRFSPTSRRRATLAIATIPVLLSVACSFFTGEDVVEKATPVMCAKAHECYGEAAFTQAYPGGDSDCVAKVKAKMEEEYGDKLDRRSACDEEELDRCLETFKTLTCPGPAQLPALPCNC